MVSQLMSALFNLVDPMSEWFTLTNKDKYAGEVYVELTFWSNVRHERNDLENHVNPPSSGTTAREEILSKANDIKQELWWTWIICPRRQ